VGATGYIVNLVVFTVLVHAAAVDYKLAALAAFFVALTNNFVWNRAWTFAASDGHAGFQAARFCVVSLAAFGFNLVVLFALVEGLAMQKVPAQAIAIAAATPLNFLGNKLWSFRT
jgi:dolichol-phosphate mannosyltransferase